jgi:quercetin dioxygenase-like cupin family protein
MISLLAVASFAAALIVPFAAGAQEYEVKAEKATIVDQEGLASSAGLAAKMIRLTLPAGYVGGRHYHTGDVFVYIESGALNVETAAGTTTYKSGEGFYETPGQKMVGSNGAADAETVIVVFQVGPKGEPLMMKAD